MPPFSPGQGKGLHLVASGWKAVFDLRSVFCNFCPLAIRISDKIVIYTTVSILKEFWKTITCGKMFLLNSVPSRNFYNYISLIRVISYFRYSTLSFTSIDPYNIPDLYDTKPSLTVPKLEKNLSNFVNISPYTFSNSIFH